MTIFNYEMHSIFDIKWSSEVHEIFNREYDLEFIGALNGQYSHDNQGLQYSLNGVLTNCNCVSFICAIDNCTVILRC